jgi:hypothetical protein
MMIMSRYADELGATGSGKCPNDIGYSYFRNISSNWNPSFFIDHMNAYILTMVMYTGSCSVSSIASLILEYMYPECPMSRMISLNTGSN